MPPDDLNVAEVRIGTDEYAVLSFPLEPLSRPAALSDTEWQVVQRLLEGMSPADIALARDTSVNTVRNQIQSIYEKLDVHSQSELARRCRED